MNTAFLSTTPLSATFISSVPHTRTRVPLCTSHQDGTRANTLTWGEGTAQGRVRCTEQGCHPCSLITALGSEGEESVPSGIRCPLRKGGFNPTNRRNKTPNLWSPYKRTFEMSVCVTGGPRPTNHLKVYSWISAIILMRTWLLSVS